MYNYKKHSTVFKRCMIAVEIIYFIVAIIIGFIFKTENRYGEDAFNWGLAIIIWASNAPLLAVLYSIYSILDNQEEQIKVSYKIFEQLQNKPKQTKTTDEMKSEKHPVQASNSLSSDNTWICPKCGDKNNQATVQCACGYIKSKTKTSIPEETFMHTCSNCNSKFIVKYKYDSKLGKPSKLSAHCPKCGTCNIITMK